MKEEEVEADELEIAQELELELEPGASQKSLEDLNILALDIISENVLLHRSGTEPFGSVSILTSSPLRTSFSNCKGIAP